MRLTERQLQVALLAAAGLTNKEIAHYLGISYDTAKNTIASVMRRLGVYGRTQILLVLVARGYVDQAVAGELLRIGLPDCHTSRDACLGAIRALGGRAGRQSAEEGA